MRQEEKEHKKICHVCGQLIGGTIGVDIHYITNMGRTRWYCDKCMKKLLRGE